ncbi:Fur family transcriptional regulator [Limnochorda pilosa]|uniref:Fur family transcriptional regulator n=1 Tax=Limnochorda pilosa TaxID=1555112 RepID=A0A0K2SP86_LIMPI|nr:Fur family transcriptional regulator [Limnochorda pilosa]BAS28634.1 Fur family transcriptional regulator [Limnochorda pilosa]
MDERVRAFREMLAERGYRVTPQRVGIYEYLAQTDRHPSAEEIYRALQERYPTMSPATVYKTLDLLVDLGLVGELAIGGEMTRYDGSPGLHLNMVCVQCRRIYDLSVEGLESAGRAAREQGGFQVLRERHEVYGICPTCQEAERHPQEVG